MTDNAKLRVLLDTGSMEPWPGGAPTWSAILVWEYPDGSTSDALSVGMGETPGEAADDLIWPEV